MYIYAYNQWLIIQSVLFYISWQVINVYCQWVTKYEGALSGSLYFIVCHKHAFYRISSKWDILSCFFFKNILSLFISYTLYCSHHVYNKMNKKGIVSPFTNGLTLIPAWTSDNMPNNVWDEITYIDTRKQTACIRILVVWKLRWVDLWSHNHYCSVLWSFIND